MRSKKKVITIGSIVILLVVIVITVIVIINKNNIKIRKNNIENAYRNLVEEVNKYNNIRDDIKIIIDEFYYNKINDEYEDDMKLFDDYSDILKNIKKDIEILDDNCQRKINDKICNGYKIIYERLVNIYINDINNFNKKLELYNAEDLSDKKLELYTNIYRDYIDYNKDNIYEEVDNGEESKES